MKAAGSPAAKAKVAPPGIRPESTRTRVPQSIRACHICPRRRLPEWQGCSIAKEKVIATSTNIAAHNPLATLQRFVRKPRARVEVCELCATALPRDHQHLLELEKHQVTCACEPCAILFSGNAHQRYRRIPRDVTRLYDFVMDDQEWKSLLIPINLAYFVDSSAAGRVIAQYPSPGGAMESSLDLEYWSAIVGRNPVLRKFEPDVEALLVSRVGETPRYYRAPIDQCFRLVGILRTNWRGLSGGVEVWKQIDSFFGQLDQLSGGPLA
jgi:hypothetical protein